MIKKILMKLMFILVVCSMSLHIFGVREIKAEDVYNINSEQDLIDYINMSVGYTFEGKTISLNTDITITGRYEGHDSLTFNKDIDIPFKGTFNGNGHTIYNLNHHSTINYETCTGLFGYTDGAIIKDLIISDSYIGADSLGGALVGRALNTTIENIRLYDTTVSVKCADNVITLITDGGLVGGGLVGVLDHSVMYNCEVNNTEVVNHATEAVAALSGKGLYLGGLVGDSKNSTIEYSRSINNTRVRNIYDVAVGAVGGNTLYVGGIAGELRDGSHVIDCFSTADLYFYCATYVSVGGGNSGHIGGIAGAAYGTRDSVVRSHFAGTASSTQYNAVLVIPIIQNDVNIFGLIDKNDGNHVEKSYYMTSTANAKGTLGDGTVSDNSGPLSDATYANRDFFEENDYDVVGNISRDTDYSSDHINKWVMYHDDTNGKTYPIHGISFMAGFDYPGSGSVTILANSANNVQETTRDAYKYALQIVAPMSEAQTIVASANEGYRLYGWYKAEANSTSVDGYDYYDEIFDNSSVVSSDTGYTFTDTQDKDLYLARTQALVNYHDYQNNIIDRTGEGDSSTSDNYYFYKETIPSFEPSNKPADTNQRFIGWTTVEGEHLSITSDELEGYKANGQFYESGQEVTESLNLYPVYANFITNIHLIYEGNELDGIDDRTLREDYGHLTASIDENNIATIQVNYDMDDLSHYRFLGWYEDGHRVSKEETYVLNDVDLTNEHTYEARFEYLVDYYIRDTHTDTDEQSFRKGGLYESVWHRYNELTKQISGPDFFEEEFKGWVLNDYDSGISSADHLITTAYEKLYSDYRFTGTFISAYTFTMTTDFPDSAQLVDNDTSSASFAIDLTENTGYHFGFWSSEISRSGNIRYQNIGNNNPYIGKHGTSSSIGESLDSYEVYRYHARMLADVIFHQYDSSTNNILRGYHENILQSYGNTRSYQYVMNDIDIPADEVVSLGGQIDIDASPVALDRPGYYFVGWIDKDTMSQSETDYVFDIDEYTSSSLAKAEPYVLDDDDLTERTMPNIYAVYVPYRITTTTNIKEIGVIPPQNLPSDPTYSDIDNTSKTSTLSFVIKDDEEYVIGDSGDKYQLVKFTVRINDGQEIEINSPYEYEVLVGNRYVFKAYYEPLVINFHVDTDEIISYVRNSGETINRNDEEMPIPTFEANGIFMGYSEVESSTGYHLLDDVSQLDDYTLVNGGSVVSHSMELYPVYVRIAIDVNSNIDTNLVNEGIDPNSVRYVENKDDYVNIVATETVNAYQFIGWYTDYVDDTNLGNLVSKDKEVIINGEDAITDKLFTAVYKQVVRVNYHGADDNRTVIYSASVVAGSRSFIESVTYIDPTTGQEVTVDTIIDGEAFELIDDSLDNNQEFINWVYFDGENTYQWDEFANETIVVNMDLYPIVVEAKAYERPLDKDGNVIFTDEIDFVSVILSSINNDDEITYECSAFFNKEYYNIEGDVEEYKRNEILPQVAIRTTETTYLPEKVSTSKSDVEVSMYKIEDGDLIDTKNTDVYGYADFPLYGLLTINNNAEGANDDFIIIVSRSEGEEYIPYLRFSLRDDESKTIRLPYGDYSVGIDNDYAWRYVDKSAVIGRIISNYRDAEVNLANTKDNKKWFDFSERKVNKYE